MNNGVFTRDFGFFPMQSRSDIHVPGLQKALMCSRYKRGLVTCACRTHEGIELDLEVVCRYPIYRVDRRRVSDEHHPCCIFRLPDDDLPRERPVPGTLIFGEQGAEMPASAGAGLGGSGIGAMRFKQFARLMWSTGYDTAWFQVNADASCFSELRCPTGAEVLSAVDIVIRGTPLRDAPDAYAGATKSDGGLVFGILESNLPSWGGSVDPKSLIPLRLGGYRNGRIDYFYAFASAALVCELREQLSILGKVIHPPYMFFAVLNKDWTIRRITLKAVFMANEGFAFIDSGLERHFFQYLINHGLPFYRSLDSMHNYTSLAHEFPLVDVVDGKRWPYRLDALVFVKRRAYIVEVRGYVKGTLPTYDALFKRKVDDWRVFCKSSQGRLYFVERFGPAYKKFPIGLGVLCGCRRGIVRQKLPRLVHSCMPKTSEQQRGGSIEKRGVV